MELVNRIRNGEHASESEIRYNLRLLYSLFDEYDTYYCNTQMFQKIIDGIAVLKEALAEYQC